MRSYEELIKDLNNITRDICCHNKGLEILVNEYDMNLLDMEVINPSKKHSMYGIPIELGEVEKPKLIKLSEF